MDGKLRSCKNCPEHMKCPGGYEKLVVDQYYWRPSNISDNVKECVNQKRCLGKDECSEGYTGKFCEECDVTKGYVRVSASICAICGPQGVSWT